MPFADVNGQHLHYEDSGGDGPPVVFCHGYLMDHEMWSAQVDALADEFRCVTWDERGFGSTESSPEPFTYWDSAADCLALLTHLGIERAALVGMSQGGFLVLRAALTAPDRVKALGLIDTQAGVEEEASLGAYRAMQEEWMANGPANVQDVVASIILGPGLDPAPWFAKWADLPRLPLARAFDCLTGREDIHERLSEITCPALVVHGTDDAAIPLERASDLCHGLAGCEGVVRVAGAPHASNMSHPDEVNGPLRDFLRRHA